MEERNVVLEKEVAVNDVVAANNTVVGSTEVDKKSIIRSQKKSFMQIGLAFFILSVIIVIAQLLAVGIVSAVWPEGYEKYANIVGLLPISLAGFPCFFICNKLFESAPAIEQKYKFGVKQFIPFIFISFGVMTVANLIGSGINYGISVIAGKEMTTATAAFMSNSDLWQNILMIGILAPILEELLFRKLVIDKLSKFGEGVAILVSALMFGLYHGNIVQLVYATALGLVFGYVYSKSKKIHFTIILHMIINFSSCFGTWVVGSINGDELLANLMEYQQAGDMVAASGYITEHIAEFAIYYGYVGILGNVIIAGIVLAIVTLVKHIKRGQMLLPGAEELVKGKKFAIVVGNVGAILFLIFWLGMLIYYTYFTYFFVTVTM